MYKGKISWTEQTNFERVAGEKTEYQRFQLNVRESIENAIRLKTGQTKAKSIKFRGSLLGRIAG